MAKLVDLLKKFGPILMFLAVLGGCAFMISLYYEQPEAELETKSYKTNLQRIDSSLSGKNVKPEYPYSPEKAAELSKISGLVDANITRLTRTVDDKIGNYVAYPQPSRPRSLKVEPDKEPVDVYASLKQLENIKLFPDQGSIFIQFDIPKPEDLKMMELVRVEVYKGKDAKSIDTKKPIGVIELGPEEAPKTAGAGAAATPAATTPEKTERVRGSGGGPISPPPATGGRGTGGRPPARVEVPKYTRAFKDTNVEQVTSYSYALRLVGRFTETEGKFVPNKKPDGTVAPGPGFKYHAPNNDPVNGKSYSTAESRTGSSTAQLFALPVTEPVSAKTPFNFALRLEGVVGEAPKPGTPRDPANPLIRTYAARFEVKVWKADLDDWKYDHVEVKEGDQISGKMRYSPKGTNEKKEYDYTADLGYKFLEIIQDVDPNSKIKGQLTDTAVVENLKTKQQEKFAKASNPKAREQAYQVLDEIWRQQEEERKKKADSLKANIDKTKTETK